MPAAYCLNDYNSLILPQGLWLAVSEGKRYPSTSWETVWQSDRGAEAKYYFTVPSDAKIRQIEYLTPTAIRRIDYSFKFEEKFSEKF